MENKEYAEMKKSIVVVIKNRNSLSTSHSIKLLQKLSMFANEYDMWTYCLANYELTMEDMPEHLKYDVDFMVRCSVLKPSILREIQTNNKALYRLILKRLGPKAVKQIKDRIKETELSNQVIAE